MASAFPHPSQSSLDSFHFLQNYHPPCASFPRDSTKQMLDMRLQRYSLFTYSIANVWKRSQRMFWTNEASDFLSGSLTWQQFGWQQIPWPPSEWAPSGYSHLNFLLIFWKWSVLLCSQFSGPHMDQPSGHGDWERWVPSLLSPCFLGVGSNGSPSKPQILQTKLTGYLEICFLLLAKQHKCLFGWKVSQPTLSRVSPSCVYDTFLYKLRLLCQTGYNDHS